MPGLQATVIGLSGTQVSITAVAKSAVGVIAFIAFGALSQRIGRRTFYVGYGVVMALLGSSCYAVVMTAEMTFPVRVAMTALVGVLTIGTFGPVASYITERFPAEIRATGFGIGYSLALVLPAFYAFYLEALDSVVSSAIRAGRTHRAGGHPGLGRGLARAGDPGRGHGIAATSTIADDAGALKTGIIQRLLTECLSYGRQSGKRRTAADRTLQRCPTT